MVGQTLYNSGTYGGYSINNGPTNMERSDVTPILTGVIAGLAGIFGYLFGKRVFGLSTSTSEHLSYDSKTRNERSADGEGIESESLDTLAVALTTDSRLDISEKFKGDRPLWQYEIEEALLHAGEETYEDPDELTESKYNGKDREGLEVPYNSENSLSSEARDANAEDVETSGARSDDGEGNPGGEE
jgi:hypothetical protein